MNSRIIGSIVLALLTTSMSFTLAGCGRKAATDGSSTSAINPVEQIARDPNLTEQQKRDAIEKLMRNSASASQK